ncbi:MAG: hypothetical protein ACR2IE_02180 [Candidatus Sumerlaeaceae bacterium]
MIKQTQFPDPADPRGAGVSPAVDGFQQITEGNSHEGFAEAVGLLMKLKRRSWAGTSKPYRKITAIQVAKLPT